MRAQRIARADAETLLARALVGSARAAGIALTPRHHHTHPWSSATYVGARHALTLLAPRAPALGRWVAALPEAELPMRGHLVADVAVERIEDDGAEVAITLAVLTLES